MKTRVVWWWGGGVKEWSDSSISTPNIKLTKLIFSVSKNKIK
jgi:hypothetical protein